jgi:RNA polymerase sigma-70 factor (ECF subfamily)
VLVLRDVLAFRAAEVSVMLGTTTAAVKSTLQRARARLRELSPSDGELAEPTAPRARELLAGYIAAFENADAAALQRLLRADATLELPPSAVWYTGDDAAATAVAGLGSPGEWRMVPATANGQPAAATYRRGRDGVYRAYGVVVLTASSAGSAGIAGSIGIARITVFADPGLLATFGLPPVHLDPIPAR